MKSTDSHVTTFLEVASKMVQLGVAIVPTYEGLRHPALQNWPNLATNDLDVIKKEWGGAEFKDHNCIAVAKHGQAYIIDIDDIAAARALGMPPLPETLTVKTPSGGLHVYGKHNAATQALGNTRNVFGNGEKVFEFKGHNAACAAPGAVRDDGGTYTIVKDLPLVELPQEIIDWIIAKSQRPIAAGTLRKRKLHPNFDPQDLIDYYGWDIALEFKKGGTAYYVFSECPLKGDAHANQVSAKKCCLIIGNAVGFKCMSCGEDYGWKELVDHMKDQGFEEYPYYIYEDEDDELLLTDVENVELGRGPTAEIVSAEQFAKFLGAIPLKSSTEVVQTKEDIDIAGFNYRDSDTGNAERLVRKYGDRIRYVNDHGIWRAWDGKAWTKDDRGQLDRMATRVVHELVEEAATLSKDDEDGTKRKMAWVKTSESRAGHANMLEMAAKQRQTVTLSSDYDKDDWSFNCQNGTIVADTTLKTVAFKPHAQSDLITRVSPAAYDPNAQCPVFINFLDRIMAGNQENITFLQRAAGYSLTGSTAEHAIFLCHGDGNNGKSTLLEAILDVVAGYGCSAHMSTFAEHKFEGIPNDIAKLAGKRYVISLRAKRAGPSMKRELSI